MSKPARAICIIALRVVAFDSAQGAEARSTTPEEFARFMREESRYLKKVIDAAKIKIE